MSTSDNAAVGVGLGAVLFILAMFAGWITHVIWVLKILMGAAAPTTGQMALGIIGAIAPPIGAIHGVYLWFS